MLKDDPCFRCPLPDCDDTDKRCVLRQLANSYYSHKAKTGRRAEVTAEELDANSRIYRSWLDERMAQAAEGIRPLNKPNSPWRGGEDRRP